MTHGKKSRPEIGIIEGFYGRPWGWDDRRDYALFLRGIGYGFYVYAPKNDPFLRKRWREFWPKQRAEMIRVLSSCYRESGIQFGIGLGPYEVYRDIGVNVKLTLSRKVQELNSIECDILCVLFDDMRGDLPDLAQLQSDITCRIAEEATAKRVIMCPTYYSFDPILEKVFGKMPAHYLEDIGKLVDPQIDIFWTGSLVCSSDYPEDHLAQVGQMLQRKPFLWDNYPVNDSAKMSRFLHLRAFENRSNKQNELISGHAVNPMNQPWLSRIPLRTLPESYSKEGDYSSVSAFEDACYDLCKNELGKAIIEDVKNFQDDGLDGLTEGASQALVEKYQKFDSPYAREIVGWLKGEYRFDPECLTE